MDAPLLIQPIVLPNEVQRQAHNFDVTPAYPLEFYDATGRQAKAVDFVNKTERIGNEGQFLATDLHIRHLY